MYSISSKGRLLNISQPLIMGILNVTSDSFYSKSRISIKEAVEKAGLMLESGASILDIGGQSTRPGSLPLDANQEAEASVPAIEVIRKAFPDCWISVDTFYGSVAKDALLAGADIVNDISSGDEDAEMLPIVAKYRAAFIAMHKKGKPQTMQNNPEYENVVKEVTEYFSQKNTEFKQFGIDNWLLDPGFGFGKTLEHNYDLLKNIKSFAQFNKPIVVGISRKGMVQKALNVSAENALNGSTALHMWSLLQGASILRVHDVAEAAQVKELWARLL